MAATENAQPPIRIDIKPQTEEQNPNWFREEDLSYVSDRLRLLLSLYGALIGYVVSAFFLLYFEKISWLAIGVTVGAIVLALIGSLRNTILRWVSIHGYATTFNFQRAVFWLYWTALAIGGVGAIVSRTTGGLAGFTLVFAALFLLLMYPYILWSRVLKQQQEGRLSILQFLDDRS